MEVLRRSSVFAAEVLDVFDRSLTEKELVSQSKALCRDYILSRLNQNGLGWSKSELNLSPSNSALFDISLVLLCLGKTNLNKHCFNRGLQGATLHLLDVCTFKGMVVISLCTLTSYNQERIAQVKQRARGVVHSLNSVSFLLFVT